MSEKVALLYGLVVMLILGCALFIAWRLQRLKVLRAEAEQRAVIAFEEMNKFTKDLRDRSRAAPSDQALPPGQRLQELYPGPKRGGVAGA